MDSGDSLTTMYTNNSVMKILEFHCRHFELKRFLHNKHTLGIFCDECDNESESGNSDSDLECFSDDDTLSDNSNGNQKQKGKDYCQKFATNGQIKFYKFLTLSQNLIGKNNFIFINFQ